MKEENPSVNSVKQYSAIQFDYETFTSLLELFSEFSARFDLRDHAFFQKFYSKIFDDCFKIIEINGSPTIRIGTSDSLLATFNLNNARRLFTLITNKSD